MHKDPASKLRGLVRSSRCDNLERANMAFGRLTEEQLDEQHGQSGETRRAIWDGCKQEREDWQAASDLLDRLLEAAAESERKARTRGFIPNA